MLHDENGVQRGRIKPPAGVGMSFVRNVPQSIAFDLDADDRRARYIHEAKSKIKAYRNGVLRGYFLVGPCTDSWDEEGRGTIKIAGMGPMWRLGRRTTQAKVTFTSVDQGEIGKQMIDTQNARYATGVRTGSVVIPATTTRTITVERDKNVLQQIRDMANAYDGFDFDVVPVDTDPQTSDIMGDFTVWAERGVNNLEVIWKWDGTGRNILTPTIVNTIDKLTTDQHITGRPDGAAVPRSDPAQVAGIQAAYRAIYDSVDALSDVALQALLDSAATQFRDWRQAPRRMFSFMPDPTARFKPWDDYDIGDRVTFRLDAGRWVGDRAIDGSVRVYGWDVQVDGPSGEERVPKLVLEENDSGGDVG